MKLQKTILTTLMLPLVSTDFCQSVEEFEKRHLVSIATAEGNVYESVATAELSSDLSFMPKCARRAGVNAGAVTIYYDVTSEGKVGNLYMTPNRVLPECIHSHVISREFTPPSQDMGRENNINHQTMIAHCNRLQIAKPLCVLSTADARCSEALWNPSHSIH